MILIDMLACTTTAKFEFPQGTRVGIINLLESHATHKNLSSFATENFTKTYQVGWDIPSYAENQIITLLEKDARFTPVKIVGSEPHQEEILRVNLIERVLLSHSSPPTLPPEGAGLLEKISRPYDVQVAVVIGSYSGPGPYKAGVGDDRFELEGYGLFTRKLFSGKLGSVFGGLFSFRKAFAYAQIGMVVYKLQPVTYIAAARAIKKGRYRRPINDFNWEANIKELPQAELKKARPIIQESIDSAIKGALQNANLTP
jgi:hypothetical protein